MLQKALFSLWITVFYCIFLFQCERLNQKRLKSFNKRNKEKLELAAILTEQRRKEREQDYDYQGNF